MLGLRISRTFQPLTAKGLDRAAGVRSCLAIGAFVRRDRERAAGSGEGEGASKTVEGGIHADGRETRWSRGGFIPVGSEPARSAVRGGPLFFKSRRCRLRGGA